MPLQTLIGGIAGEEQALAELTVLALVRAGKLRIIYEHKEPIVEILSQPAASDLVRIESQLPLEQPRVVATIPLSLHPGLKGLPTKPTPTDEAFEEIMGSAKHYLKLCLPFPEEYAVTHFGRHIGRIAEQGVRVKLLTRELLSPSSRSFDYAALVRSVMRLVDIYRVRGAIDRLQIRDFHSNIALGDDGLALHYESIHAKILISDGTSGYVGSAEFRGNSLLNNFELGFLIRGPAVQEVEALYDLVWNAAAPVSYEQILHLGRPPRIRSGSP